MSETPIIKAGPEVITEAEFLQQFGEQVESVEFSRLSDGCEMKTTYRLRDQQRDVQRVEGRG